MAMKRVGETIGYVQELPLAWPAEFSGITHLVQFRYHYLLAGALDYLKYEAMTNTHGHNIAVSFADHRIYTTATGVECITRHVEEGLKAELEHVTD